MNTVVSIYMAMGLKPSTDEFCRILMICGILRIPDPTMMARPMHFEMLNLIHSTSLKSNC